MACSIQRITSETFTVTPEPISAPASGLQFPTFDGACVDASAGLDEVATTDITGFDDPIFGS